MCDTCDCAEEVLCLFPAVRAANLSSPCWGSDVSLRILWNCSSSSLGKRWRPPVYSHTWKKRPLWYTMRCFRSVRCCTTSECKDTKQEVATPKKLGDSLKSRLLEKSKWEITFHPHTGIPILEHSWLSSQPTKSGTH